MPETATSTELTELAVIDPGYRHTEKSIVPHDDLLLAGAALKWYDIHLPDQITPTEIREQAANLHRREAGVAGPDVEGLDAVAERGRVIPRQGFQRAGCQFDHA